MKTQYDNQLLNSFLYYLDNKIIVQGSGFSNISSTFRPIGQTYGGYYTYSTPFNQLIADRSISGPNVISGVIVSGTFIPPGRSGLHAIDYFNGRCYFSGAIASTVSGNFAVKDFNIKMSVQSDEEILFENSYWNRLKNGQNITGLYTDEMSYPVIYIRNDGGYNEPFQFGERANHAYNNIRALIVSDNQWNLDAAMSVMKDLAHDYVPLIHESEIPFNVWGDTRSSAGYNYTNLTQDKVANNSGAFIESVRAIRFNSQSFGSSAQRSLPNRVYFGIVDFDICYLKNLNANYTYGPVTEVSGQLLIDELGNFFVDEGGNFLSN